MSNKISHSSYQLKCHHDYSIDKGSSLFHINVNLQKNNSHLKIDFFIGSKFEDHHKKEWNYSTKWQDSYYKNWLLWEEDVVEFFLQFRNDENDESASYTEFLVNPYNKKFALMTIKPRLINWTPTNIKFSSKTQLEDRSWKTSIEIDLDSLNYKEETLLYGNFHTCLGKSGQRSFWSAFNKNSEAPDFHRPHQFQRLL